MSFPFLSFLFLSFNLLSFPFISNSNQDFLGFFWKSHYLGPTLDQGGGLLIKGPHYIKLVVVHLCCPSVFGSCSFLWIPLALDENGHAKEHHRTPMDHGHTREAMVS